MNEHDNWCESDHQRHFTISERMLEDMANRAADKAADRVLHKMKSSFFEEVGQTVLQKMLWLIGIVIVGLATVFSYKGANPL